LGLKESAHCRNVGALNTNKGGSAMLFCIIANYTPEALNAMTQLNAACYSWNLLLVGPISGGTQNGAANGGRRP
jgi:hypothetical protein